MENRSHALMTGLFTIALLIAAVLFGLWFNRDKTVRVPYQLVTTLAVPGLNAQAAVRYRGLDVGRVDAIEFDPQVSGQILVRLSVDPGAPITRTTFATLGYQGVTGIAYVELDDDRAGSPRLATSAEQPARIALRPGLLDQLEQSGKAILAQTQQVAVQLNHLLDADNQRAMRQAIDHVSQAALAFGAIPRQLGPTLAQLPALAAQARQSLGAVSGAAAEVGGVAARLQAQGGAIDQIGDTVARVGQSVQKTADSIELDALPNLVQLGDETRSSLRALKNTLNTVNQRPQSLLLGAPAAAPGPGEAGFVAPIKEAPP